MSRGPAPRALGGPLARLIADERIVCAEMDPRSEPADDLLPTESVAVQKAVEKRRREYAAGRRLARQALTALGLAPTALVSDADRVPRWPEGVIGSITHTDAWCAVALGATSLLEGIGIDVETRKNLSPELWPRICRPEELEWLGRNAATDRGLLAKGIFSAKESLYKALFPTVRRYLGFEAVTLRLEPEAEPGRFVWHAQLQRDYGSHPAGERFGPGQLCIGEPFVRSAVCLWKADGR